MPGKLNLLAGLRIGLLWVMVSALGGSIGFALGFWAANTMPDFVGRTGLDTVRFGFFGSLVSVAQWLVLRSRSAKAGWWVLVSSLVWIGIGALAYTLEQTIPFAFCPAVAGGVLGICQSLVLRRHGRWSGFWVVGSIVGWALGWPVAGALDRVVAVVVTDEILGFTVLYAIIAAVSGVFTGPALALLLGYSQRERLQRGERAASY